MGTFVGILIKQTVNLGEGTDPRSGLIKGFFGRRIFYPPRLQIQQTAHNLKIILHPVVNIQRQNGFCRQRCLKVSITRLNRLRHDMKIFAERA